MKRKLAFYWLIVLVTMTTPISSHVKDKNDMFTARGEDMKERKERYEDMKERSDPWHLTEKKRKKKKKNVIVAYTHLKTSVGSNGIRTQENAGAMLCQLSYQATQWKNVKDSMNE